MRVLSFLVASALAACGSSSSGAGAPPTRTDLIRRGDAPLTLVGRTPEVGGKAPEATLRDAKLGAVTLSSFAGKLLVLSVVPSIDTRVCEAQTHKVSDAIAQMPPDTVVMTISRDLPFAQERFAEEAMTKTLMASDYKERAFGRAWGLDVAETGLLARSVWVVRKDGTIAYRELVADQTHEPDYDALLAAIRTAAN